MKSYVLISVVASVAFTVPALAGAAPAKPSKADAIFLTKDAQGSAFELATAKLAADKASREDVKAYARKLVGDHDTLNAALAKLGQDEGVTLPTEMTKADQARLAKLEALSGPAFDEAYVAEAERINAQDKRDSDKEKRATKDAAIKDFIQRFSDVDAEHEKRAKALKAGKT